MKREALYATCFVLAALLFLWTLVLHPDFLPARPSSTQSDLLLSHLPNAKYLRDSLARYGQLPLWNAQILSGQPFAADPLSGLWYLPNVLLLILPLPFAFNLLFVLHLAWAGYGMFCYLRAEHLDVRASFFGGLALAGTPKILAHLGAGHVSLIFAIAWTPWLLLSVKRAASEGGFRRGAIIGGVLALIALADVRWAFYAGALAVVFWIAHLNRERVLSSGAICKAMLSCLLFFLSLSAILTLPLAEFTYYSNRGGLDYDQAVIYSLPPYPYLLGVFVPIYGVLFEWVTYIGIVPLLLAVFGSIHRRQFFWIAVVFVAILFSLGSNLEFFPWAFRLMPVLKFLRVPARAWFIVAISGCILAAYGMQVIFAELLPRLAGEPQKFPLLSRWMPPARFLFPFLVIITAIDLLMMNNTQIEARPLADESPAAKWIAEQPGLFRVYSPSASLPLPNKLQHVEGVDPLQLSTYARYAARASGIAINGYSVSVPFYFVEDGDDPARLQAASSPDSYLLGMLNVKYVAAEFPLAAPPLSLVKVFGRTRVYENLFFRPRAWIESGVAEVKMWSPNKIIIQAEGSGLLVVSEIAYPGWEAHVDGVGIPLVTVEDLFRGVNLSTGSHEVVLEFYPRSVYVGASLTLLGLILFAVVCWRSDECKIIPAIAQG